MSNTLLKMNDLINQILSLFSKKSATVIAEKKQIRQEIRSLKKLLTDEQKQAEAKAVFEKIEMLPEFKIAETILMYWSTTDELPTQAAISNWCTEKQLFLPSINGEKMVLKHYSPNGKLVQKSLGIWEPDLAERYDGKIDLVIVPGIAFDRKKNRLGRGKGYYDRFFKKFKPVKIGVGFDFQLMHSIPVAKHDIKMDKIITPSQTIL
ncbi:MAG TPA: 5-formyltetrahydrofolate cyclo-ligase [Paludibacter sp.]|nr:5-formyltetrahydrofolate cyclo-ligase [Paludibacter sp.]